MATLVPDRLLNEIVAEKISNNSGNGFILDGYPRTVEQYNFIENFFNSKQIKLDFIFNIKLDYEILENRIKKRAAEEGRDDDKINILKTRYQEYVNSTKKVSDLCAINHRNIFTEIEGNDDISKIRSKIIKIVKNSIKT